MATQAFHGNLSSAAHHAAHRHQTALTVIARSGYAARGVVYLLVGGLAFLSALGRRGESGDQRDALQAVMHAPAGGVMLTILAIGLMCFALWRFLQAALNPDHHPHTTKGYFTRTGRAVSGVMHVGLAIAAWYGGQTAGDNEKSWTAWLMTQPFGPWLVAIVGAIIIGAGIAQVTKAVILTYENFLELERPTLEKLRPLFRFGLLARAFVFGTIGVFFLYAAWTYDPNQAGGLKDVFNEVRSHMFGTVLLGLLAAGLFAFGVYGLAQARYRRITT